MELLKIAVFVSLFLPACASLTRDWLPHSQSPEAVKQREAEEADRELQRVKFTVFTKVYAAVDPSMVELTSKESSPASIEIGLLSVYSERTHKPGNEDAEENELMVSLLKRKAALVGANTITKYEAAEIPVGSREANGIYIGTGVSSSNRNIRCRTKLTGIAARTQK